MKNAFAIIMLSSVISMSYGQDTYKTMEGHIVMLAEINGEQAIAESHKLSILLDYKTKEVSGRLDLRKVDTGIDDLNRKLQELQESLWVEFRGIIPYDDFISQLHLPISFDWPVTVTMESRSFKMTLNTTLKHFTGGKAYACLLSAGGDLSSEKAGLDEIVPGISGHVKIQFTQVVLRQE